MPDQSLNLTNRFLLKMPGDGDDLFAGALIYVCEHTPKGAMGLVVNKPIAITLPQLFEKIELKLERDDLNGAPVFFGGPVQTERGFVLHAPLSGEGSHYNSSLKVPGGLEMTTSKDVLEALSSGAGPSPVMVTLGYSGWAAGQLEEEMGRNAWIHVEAPPELLNTIVFDTPIPQRYERALGLLGITSAMLTSEHGHA